MTPAETNPLLNTWSLSVEEQFYLAFPAVLALGWLVARRYRSFRAAPTVLVGAVAVLSFGLAGLTSSGRISLETSWLHGFYSPVTRAWEFAVGALLALALAHVSLESRRTASAIGILGLTMLAASLWLISGTTTPFPGVWTLLPVSGTLLLILAGTNDTNFLTRGLGARPMVKVGDLSYSIYLWHWPLIVFAGLLFPANAGAPLAAAGLSLAPALASYRWLEQPIRSMAPEGPRRFALIYATVIPPLALALMLGVGAGRAWGMESVAAFRAEVRVEASHTAGRAGCLEAPNMSEGICEWNSQAPGDPVFLLGDSNADTYSNPTIAAGVAMNRPVWVGGWRACPFLDLQTGEARCRAFLEESMEWLGEQPKGTLVLAFTDSYFWDPKWGFGPEALEGALKSTVRSIETMGHSVVVVLPLHRYNGTEYPYDPSVCSTWTISRGECTQVAPRSYIEKLQAPSRAAIVEALDGTNAVTLDLRDRVCEPEFCATFGAFGLRYADPAHVSVSQSEALTSDFTKALMLAK